jgi:hypothetical protein
VFSNYNWDIDYPMDRIVFPYTGYPSYPPLNYIYPKDKSALEHLLDQYFDVERQDFTLQEMHKMVAAITAKGGQASLIYLDSNAGGFYAEAFADPSVLTPLPSWSRSRDPVWRPYPSEQFQDISGHIERIHLPAADRASLERAIAFGVKQVLDSKPQLRARLVEWRLEGAAGDLPTEDLTVFFRNAWSGMRFLPFSNAQISAAFSAIAGLVSVSFDEAGLELDDRQGRFSAVRGDGLYVEFGYTNSSSSSGYASKEAVRRAMRDDLKTLVLPKYHDWIEEVEKTFQLIQNPTLLFEFEPFVDIFARDLIPSQVVLGRSPILFNPAATATFGRK